MAGLRGKKNVEEEIKVIDKAVETAEEIQAEEVQEVELVEEPKVKVQPNVRILPNADLRTYIGDQWYSFKKGVHATVPQQVKEVLAKANYLDVL
jgi:hypothetical protein